MIKKNWNRLIWVFMLIMLLLNACSVLGEVTTKEGIETTESAGDDTTEMSVTDTTELLQGESGAEESEAEELENPYYRLNAGSPLAGIPVYSYDTYSDYWDVENDAEMLLFSAENGEGHAQYLKDLAAAGFSLYAENEIVGNLYSTWTKDELIVTVMYVPALGSVRLLAEPLSIGLPGLEEENEYTDGGYENLVIQIGTQQFTDPGKNNGMCYVYRLCDGSFIVVDMGFNVEGCADNLYETLAKYAPDPENIVIAAFFISHPHRDHIGGFYAFADKYSDKVTLEQVIFNYPTQTVFGLSGDQYVNVAATEKGISQFKGCKTIEAHPGQEFYIRDAYVEMLYTWDLFSTQYCGKVNNTTIVFSITMGDTKIMQLGDCGPLASPIVAEMYGDYLDSDVIQVAHHGNKGATRELNLAINAEVILYPAGEENYTKFFDVDRNSPFRDKEYVYVADERVTVIPLPFDPETVEIWEWSE